MTDIKHIKLPLDGKTPPPTDLSSGTIDWSKVNVFGGFANSSTGGINGTTGSVPTAGFAGFSSLQGGNALDPSKPLFSGFAGFSQGAGGTQSFSPSYGNSPSVKLDKNFLNKVKEIAQNLNCNYEDLLAIMNSESGLNSKAVNSKGGATGLIQFMPETARELGTSTQALKNMSPTEQLVYVEKYLQKVKSQAGFGAKDKLSAGDLYALIFMPANAKKEVLTSAGTKAYSYNKGLDKDGNGQITKNDLARHLASKHVNINEVFG